MEGRLMVQTETGLRRYLPVAAIFAASLFGIAACGSAAESSTSSTSAAPTATQSATTSPTTEPVGGWPADVPAPAGLKSMGASETTRLYTGSGTAESVAAQMTGAFTDVGYQIDGRQVVSEAGVTVGFTKGSTDILMVVSEPGGKGSVSCVLGLTR
jgi:hypothetical protein